MHGTAIAMALYGTAFGAALGTIPANKIGRKKTLIWIGILFLLTSVGAALAQDVYTFMIFRFISGLSIGASSVVAPVYISEIAPAKY
ncbi:MFS transporter, partial [Acinetobacter baumannii]